MKFSVNLIKNIIYNMIIIMMIIIVILKYYSQKNLSIVLS